MITIGSLPTVFYLGVGLGLATAILPGPILILTIAETIRSGHRSGLAVLAAPVLVDAIIMIPLALVLKTFLTLYAVKLAIGLVGSVVLFWLGYNTIKSARTEHSYSDDVRKVVLKKDSPFSSFKKAVIAHLFSPIAYVFWATVGTYMLYQAFNTGKWPGVIAFSAGFWSGATIEGLAAIFLSSKGRAFLDTSRFRVVLIVCGSFLIIFGLIIAVRVILNV